MDVMETITTTMVTTMQQTIAMKPLLRLPAAKRISVI
jgi:hypothetical protein